MRQLTLATASFDKHSKQTRRAKFLAEMDQVVPWRELCALVAPFYPKAGNGRPPIGLERMLRLHFLQHCWGGRPDGVEGVPVWGRSRNQRGVPAWRSSALRSTRRSMCLQYMG